MTKKKKGIIIGLVVAIVIAAVGVGLYFGIGPGKATSADVEVADGEIYRTQVETFWAGVGKAYISFQHKEEPENKAADDTEVYGDVFYVMVSSGENFDPWLSGNYNLDDANGKLTMSADWDNEAENQTKLADANPNEEKVINAENGEYKIGVELPSAGTIVFTLNPATDKVGSLTEPVAVEEEAKDDAEEIQNTGNIFARLIAQDSLFDNSVICDAQLDMNKDNSWVMKVKVEPYAPSWTNAITGTWVENSDGSLTLTATGGDYKNSVPPTFNFTKGSDGVYTGTVRFAADEANDIVFTLKFKSVDISKDNTASSGSSNSSAASNSNQTQQPSTVTGEYRVTMNENGIYSNVVGTSYISFLPDGSFSVMVKAQGTLYDSWISGTWKVNDNKLTLTSEANSDTGIDGIKNSSVTYTAKNGTVTVKAHFQGGGTASYTVDLNVLTGKTSTPSPSTPSNSGDSGNNGGNNSNTGNTGNNGGQQASQGDIKLTGETETTGVTCLGDMLIKTDNTWKLQLNVYNMGYQDGLWGTWSKNSDGSLALKVTGQNDQLSNISKSIKVNYNSNTKEYSATIKFTSAGFDFTLPLNGKDTGSTAQPDQTVAVTGVTLNSNSLELTVGKTATLSATVSPSNATNKGVTWTSVEESVVTVDNGKITAKAAGTTYIVTATKDGGFTASCKVVVSEPSADNEYYVATTDTKWYGAFEMSIIFDNGTFYWHGQEGSPADDSWFRGTYSFNSDKTELTMNVDYNADSPHLEAAEATQANSVIFTSENGKFTIAIKDSSAASINGTFTLTVGTGTQTPGTDPEPEEPKAELKLELTATDKLDLYGTEYVCDAKLDLYDDNSFKMLVKVPGMFEDYIEAASGAWAMNADYSITLTVTAQTIENSLAESIKLDIDYATMQYSGAVEFAASQYTVFNLKFGHPASEPETETQPNLQLEMTANDTVNFNGTDYVCDAKLDLYDDKTFKMLVKVPGMFDDYIEAADGVWTMNADYSIVLTVKKETLEGSMPQEITVICDYSEYPNLKYNSDVAFNTGYFAFDLKFNG